MFNFPYSGFPYNYEYYNNYYNYYNRKIKDENKNASIIDSQKSNNTRHNSSSFNSEQALFEIFGIKLYLDDIIILCLLFFLYQEEVKDEMLYIILFLLLFS